MTFINTIGLLICMGGITCHVIHKIKNTQQQIMQRSYESDFESTELEQSLMNNSVDQLNISSDSEHSDSQELFNILNSHDR